MRARSTSEIYFRRSAAHHCQRDRFRPLLVQVPAQFSRGQTMICQTRSALGNSVKGRITMMIELVMNSVAQDTTLGTCASNTAPILGSEARAPSLYKLDARLPMLLSPPYYCYTPISSLNVLNTLAFFPFHLQVFVDFNVYWGNVILLRLLGVRRTMDT